MLYPNLAAEIEAQKMTGEFSFETLAIEANVTPDILREVVWGNEDLTLDEALPLYRALSPWQNYEGYSPRYLYSSTLATVEPHTRKAKYRIRLLRQLLTESESLSPHHWWADIRKRAWAVLARMERGETVTYAEYRASITIARHIIADRTRAASKVATRRGVPLERGV